MENPWNICSIYELQYFNCPSCAFRDPSKQGLVNHAYEFHPEAVIFLANIKDYSLFDVVCPWNNEFSKMKTETSILDDEITYREPFIDDPLKIESEEHFNEDIETFDVTEEYLNELKDELKSNEKNQPNKISTKKCIKVNEVSIRISRIELNNCYKCDQCDKYFYNKDALKQHMCRKSFMCKSDKKKYSTIRKVHKIQKKKCNQCGKSYDKRNLQRHINQVHEGLKYKCELCQKMFSEPANLKRHIMCVHDKQKPYRCSVCNKAFGQKSDMEIHTDTVHGNLKPHACNFCSLSFYVKKYLKIHIKRVHKDLSRNRKSQKTSSRCS